MGVVGCIARTDRVAGVHAVRRRQLREHDGPKQLRQLRGGHVRALHALDGLQRVRA
jgi:hypothetical protein